MVHYLFKTASFVYVPFNPQLLNSILIHVNTPKNFSYLRSRFTVKSHNTTELLYFAFFILLLTLWWLLDAFILEIPLLLRKRHATGLFFKKDQLPKFN